MSLKRPTQEYVLTEAKIDAVKANISKIARDSYTGNNTVNRAIPHGLSIVPKLVFFMYSSDGRTFSILRTGYISMMEHSTNPTFTVTAVDATNFYVGNSAEYSHSANGTGVVYYWVAIG